MRSLFPRCRNLLTLVVALAASTWVGAQGYPQRPVKIVVPFATGGPADNYARFIAQRLQDAMGQSFVVDNKPGAGSVIGTDVAAKAPADGYTLLLMSNASTVNETLIPNKPYSLLRDFVGVAPINYSDLVLVAYPGTGMQNAADLIKRAQAQPGKLNYASSGPGTPYHMAGELFKSMAKIDLVHIPYKGSSGARTDVLGGQVDLMCDQTTTTIPQIEGKKVKSFAVTTPTRLSSPVLKDNPTMQEAGLKDFSVTIWQGLYAPKGTPAPVLKKLNDALKVAVKDPDFIRKQEAGGATVITDSRTDPAGHKAFVMSEVAKWAPVIRAAGVYAD